MPQPTQEAVDTKGGNHKGCCPLPQSAKAIHSFSKTIAEEYSIPAALVAAYLGNRIQNTKVNGQRKPYRVTLDELKVNYPYLSRGTISNALNCLVKGGFLNKRNTNRRRYDRTGSYEFALPTDIPRAHTDPIYLEVADAVSYGPNAAIILNNLKYWLSQPDALQYHPLSPTTLIEHLPFLSEDQIKAAIKKLTSEGAILADPDIPKNRAQAYRLGEVKIRGEKLDVAENSRGEFLDGRGEFLDIRGENLDVRGGFLDNDIQLIEDISSFTLKENCFKVPASETPSTYAAISPFEKPAHLPVANAATQAPQPQVSVTRTSTPSSIPLHHQFRYPPLPPCSPSTMTESLPATLAEAEVEYAAFIKAFTKDELLDLQELLFHNFKPFIRNFDLAWLDCLFVPRPPEEFYQHLKCYADEGLSKSITSEERNDHKLRRPYRVFSLIFLVWAFNYCHPDISTRWKHSTQVTYSLTNEIGRVYDYRSQQRELQLQERHQQAMANLEDRTTLFSNDEESKYSEIHLSPGEKARVLQHYIDQANAIGYIDSKAEVMTGVLTYTEFDLKAARLFFTTNPALSAGDIGDLMVQCQTRSKGFIYRKEACEDLIIDGIKLGKAILHLAQIASRLGTISSMPSFKTMTFEELYPHYRKP